jgi:transposase
VKSIKRLGIDLAKSVFELCGVNERGEVILRKTVKRKDLLIFISNIEKTEICMEACGGSHYWARKFGEIGHKVRIIPASYVKPFVKSQKNDQNDALAITEAASRPTMNFVQPKEIWQQDLQLIHRVRSRLMAQSGQLRNQMRGFLMEYGLVIGEGLSKFQKSIPLILEDSTNDLTLETRAIMHDLFEEYNAIEQRKKKYDLKVQEIAKKNPLCKRLTKIPGVGPLTSTIFVAQMGNAEAYKNGRQAAASLGLVPRQRSTGGRSILQGITKRGDPYVRCLLVHGARSAVKVAAKALPETATPEQQRIKKMLERKHMNVVVIAVANRNARIMLTMLKSGKEYQAA